MTREEAIKIIRDTYHTDEEMKALESLIPELRESEDERIRSAMIRGFNSMMANHPVNTFYGVSIRDILSYLEKQKELTPADGWDYADKRMSHPLYLEGFEAGRAVERELSEFEKQKEQKPAEWSEEDEILRVRTINRLERLNFHGISGKEIRESIDWLKSLRPSWKPSEEQMRQLCDAAYLKAKISDDIYVFPELRSLYYDLQKLT